MVASIIKIVVSQNTICDNCNLVGFPKIWSHILVVTYQLNYVHHGQLD